MVVRRQSLVKGNLIMGMAAVQRYGAVTMAAAATVVLVGVLIVLLIDVARARLLADGIVPAIAQLPVTLAAQHCAPVPASPKTARQAVANLCPLSCIDIDHAFPSTILILKFCFPWPGLAILECSLCPFCFTMKQTLYWCAYILADVKLLCMYSSQGHAAGIRALPLACHDTLAIFRRRGRPPKAAAVTETPASGRHALRNVPAASMPPPVTPRAATSTLRSARTNRTAPVSAGEPGPVAHPTFIICSYTELHMILSLSDSFLAAALLKLRRYVHLALGT